MIYSVKLLALLSEYTSTAHNQNSRLAGKYECDKNTIVIVECLMVLRVVSPALARCSLLRSDWSVDHGYPAENTCSVTLPFLKSLSVQATADATLPEMVHIVVNSTTVSCEAG